jgi:hypothetical protein
MYVPPGLTSISQPADVSWNRPLKVSLRNEWQKYMMQQIDNSNHPGWRLESPSRSNIAHWVKNAWNSLTPATIANGFKKAGFPYKKFDDNIPLEPIEVPENQYQELLQSLGDLNLIREEEIDAEGDSEAEDGYNSESNSERSTNEQ